MTKTTKVKFLLPAHIVGEATQAKLIGEFNQWNTEEALAFSRTENGNIECVLELQPGKTYQYKYLLNDGRWVTDEANKTWVEVYGGVVENSIISIPEVVEPEVKKTATKKAAETTDAAPKKATAKKATSKKAEVDAEAPAKKAPAKKPSTKKATSKKA